MELAVDGIACGACIARIEGAVRQLPGVTEARLNFTNRRLHVAWSDGVVKPAQILTSARRHRLSAAIPSCRCAPSRKRPPRRARLTRCLAVAGFAAMNVMLLSVSVWSGNSHRHHAGDARLLPLGFGADRAAGRRPTRAGRSSKAPGGAARRAALNMNVPISLGVILALGMSVVETANHAEHAYFDSALMLLFFLLVRARARSRDAPQDARGRRQSGGIEGRDGASLRRRRTGSRAGGGDRKPATGCWSKPGERVPADGMVLTGNSEIDESLITGETARRKVASGATIYAGSMNDAGDADDAGDGGRQRHAGRRDRETLGKGGEREVARHAARRPRRARLCAGRASDRGADLRWLADRRRERS